MNYTSTQIAPSGGYGKIFPIRKDPPVRSQTEVKTKDAQQTTQTDEASKPLDHPTKNGPAERLLKMAEPVERFMQSIGVNIKLRIHEETNQIQAEIKSADGEKTIRKIPTDDILKLVASIKEMSQSERMVDTTF